MARTKRCVLVIDDNDDILEFVRFALEDQGYEVLTAIDGGALPLAHATQPDVILLDLTMPGMSGEEVCAQLRDDPATARIPVVAMSADPYRAGRAERAAFSDRLDKPFDLDDLFATVQRWAAA
jgi:CheY-like chemotaxis protein